MNVIQHLTTAWVSHVPPPRKNNSLSVFEYEISHEKHNFVPPQSDCKNGFQGGSLATRQPCHPFTKVKGFHQDKTLAAHIQVIV